MTDEDREADDREASERESGEAAARDAARERDEDAAFEDASPGGERSPSDVGPDASTAGGHPEESERAPLSDLREDVEQRREQGAADDDDFEELFTEMDVGDVDEETVWSEVGEAAQTPSVGAGEAVADDTETGGGGATDDVHDTRDVTVVEKRQCHNCPHFADPPETACTHDGTTIEAEVDTDHFRVVDCPVVAKREEMETGDFSPDDL